MSHDLRRFSIRQRVEHALVMSSFTLLALTGLPQKFYDAGAPWWHLRHVFTRFALRTGESGASTRVML